MTALVGTKFLEATLGYLPRGESWLVSSLAVTRHDATFGPIFSSAGYILQTNVRGQVMLVVALLTLMCLRRTRANDASRAAAIYLLFLTSVAAAAAQYAVWPVALLAALRPGIAAVYGLFAASWIVTLYAYATPADLPLLTTLTVFTPTPSPWLAAGPVLISLAAVVSLVRRA
jgi:hypothetical protein